MSTATACRPGTRAVVFTNNDNAYAAALDLADAGRRGRRDRRSARAPTAAGRWPRRARGHRDPRRPRRRRRPRPRRGDAASRSGASTRRRRGRHSAGRSIACDLSPCSGGWKPAVHLFSQSRRQAALRRGACAFVPDRLAPGRQPDSVGGAAAASRWPTCLAEGMPPARRPRAARASTQPAASAARRRSRAAPGAIRAMWVVPVASARPRRAKHFVDLQNDVTAADIALAAREGYRSVEHAEALHHARAWAPTRARLGNVNGLAILADARRQRCREVGTTTFRPPYTPVTFGALAGRGPGDLFEPDPQDAAACLARGARRAVRDRRPVAARLVLPAARARAMHDAVNRECLAARNARRHRRRLDARQDRHPGARRGDSSSTGSTPTPGRSSSVGRCRYGLMLRRGRHGDGRRRDQRASAEHHFLMTTTTGGAARVHGWLEDWLQTEWPDLKVYLTSVTEHWATVGGRRPEAAQVAGEVAPTSTSSAEASRFMSFTRRHGGRRAGARLPHQLHRRALLRDQRAAPPTRWHVWEALMAAGRAVRHHALRHRGDARAARREGLHHRRPGDRRHGHAARPRHGLDRQQEEGLPRQALAGALRHARARPQAARRPADRGPGEVLPEGAPDRRRRVRTRRRCRCSATSPRATSARTCGRSIAMALVEGRPQPHGRDGRCRAPTGKAIKRQGRPSRSSIDPEGARING